MHQAEKANLNQANRATEVARIIEAVKDKTIPLASEDRLAIIKILPMFDITTDIAREIVGLAEALNPEHRGRVIGTARIAMRPEFDDKDNVDLFDRLADMMVSLRTDGDTSQSMLLLTEIRRIPESARLTRFDRLAPLSKTIQDEQKKAESISSIALAIRKLPSAAMMDRFTTYADETQSIQSDKAKATAAARLAHCILDLPGSNKRDAFDKLVSIARSINESNDKERVVSALRQVSSALPQEERDAALSCLATELC